MGTVRVIVLRLFVDPARPGRLAGALRRVPDGLTLPFGGEAELLAALRRLAEDREGYDKRAEAVPGGATAGKDLP